MDELKPHLCARHRRLAEIASAAQAVVEAAVAIEMHDESLECAGGQDCNDLTNRLADELSSAVRAYRKLKSARDPS